MPFSPDPTGINARLDRAVRYSLDGGSPGQSGWGRQVSL